MEGFIYERQSEGKMIPPPFFEQKRKVEKSEESTKPPAEAKSTGPSLAEIEADEAPQRARVEKRQEENRRRQQKEAELEEQNAGKGF